jgi:hypothetical protein
MASTLLSKSCAALNLLVSMVGTKSGASVKRRRISSRGLPAVSGRKAQKKMALVRLQTYSFTS